MAIEKHERIRGICMLIVCIFFLSFQFNLNFVIASSDTKKVLVLQSYHRGHEWSDCEGNAIVETLSDSDMKVETYLEHMDWKRHPDDKNLEQLYERFQYKFSNKKLDLIMTTDDAALKFVLNHRGRLFPGVPVVFCGVMKQDAEILLDGQRNVTGIYQVMDPEGTLYVAKK